MKKEEAKLINTFDSPTTLELAYCNQPKKIATKHVDFSFPYEL